MLYCTVSGADALESKVLPSDIFKVTVPAPRQVPAGTALTIDSNLFSNGLNCITFDTNVVSTPHADVNVSSTRYLCFELEQFDRPPESAKPSPGLAVVLLSPVMPAVAQPPPPPPPLPPLGLPFCADSGIDTNARHASAKKLLIM